jgi:glycosyltransferase involved in cell wall biosynthesis
MKISYLLGSVSRNAGGLFDICRRLAQTIARNTGVSVLGLEDEFTGLDLKEWLPLRPTVFPAAPPRSFGYARGYARALEIGNPELVHVHGLWMYPSLCGYRWHQRTKRPLIYTAHGMLDPWAVRNSRWKKRLVGSLWEDAAHRSATCFHVNSETEYLTLRSYGLRNPIAIVPNGMDFPDLSTKNPAPWRGEISNRRVLLYLGRLHLKKNLPALIDAWKAARGASTKAREWVLVIAGWDQGEHEALLRKQVCELGVEESVYFAGPLFGDQKAGAYQHAEAFVLPSLSEGLPMVILEAWAYGKPVVMTPDCNLPEGLAAGAALSTGKTADAIAETLCALFEMEVSERKQMGERGRALVSEKFLWPGIADEMKNVCEWAVGGGEPPGCVRFN